MNSVAGFWKMEKLQLGVCWLIPANSLAWTAVLERRNVSHFSMLMKESCEDPNSSSAGRSWLRWDLAGQACLQRNAEEMGRMDPGWERCSCMCLCVPLIFIGHKLPQGLSVSSRARWRCPQCRTWLWRLSVQCWSGSRWCLSPGKDWMLCYVK